MPVSGVISKHGPTLSGRIQKTNEPSPEMKLCFIVLEVTPENVVFIGNGKRQITDGHRLARQIGEIQRPENLILLEW